SGQGIEDFDIQVMSEGMGALLNAIADQFGLETPFMNVRIELGDPHNHVLMAPDGKMTLRYANKNILQSVAITNTATGRAMGRAIVRWHLLHTITTPFGLPEGLTEGFAAYIADEALMQATGKFDLAQDKLPPATAKYRRMLADLDAAV